MAVTIMLDAGHGGYDNGATYYGRREKDDNLRLTLAVGEALQRMGFNVLYTRTEDVYDSVLEKAAIANNSSADYFVSIHRNSSPTPNTYSGVQTLIYDDSGIKADMARNVNAQLESVGFQNLGIEERTNLAVLRRTRMPAILIEAGFINTDADNTTFDNNFDAMAQAIADGIAMTVRPEAQSYYVQTGLFRVYGNAAYRFEELEALGYPAGIYERGGFYAVLVGPYSSLDTAVNVENALRQTGYETLIVN